MAMTTEVTLDQPLRYADFVIFRMEDGSWMAEPTDPTDLTQIVSFDIVELCAAIDAGASEVRSSRSVARR